MVIELFLYASYGYLFSNMVLFVLIGWVLLLFGLCMWLMVIGIVIVVGGLIIWLIALFGIVVGVSGLVFGWFGYLFARVYFFCKLKWIITVVFVLFFFGMLLVSLLLLFEINVLW